MPKTLPAGTCPECGYVPGTVSRKLKRDEKKALVEAGFTLHKTIHGDDQAAQCLTKDSRNMVITFFDALGCFHRLGHPKPHAKLQTALERLRDDKGPAL